MTALVALVNILSTLTSSSGLSNGAPATVYFTPYVLSNCSMSTNATSDSTAESYAVTTGTCYNSSYAFESYAYAANFPAETPCAFSIFPQAGCTGESVGVNLTETFQCYTGPLDAPGESFELACGP